MKKINLYFLTFIFLFFANPSFSVDQEIREIVDSIDAAKNDFNDVDTSEVIEAVKMDKAFEQIDKVTEFVKEALQDGNEDSAIKALEFIEKSLAGTNALVPQEFSSDMSKADFGSFGEDKMAIVNEITADMKVTKDEKLNDLISGMMDISEEGIDSFGIVETLNKIGIETIDVAIAISKKKEMATWTKEEWANSWNGDILTDDGKQIISDGEINSNLSSLEQKLQANSLDILNKKSSLTDLQIKIDPLSGQITDLKTQKTDLLAKYNEEIIKQSSNILSDEEINKSKGLADEFNSQLSNLTNQINTAEEQSNSLQQQVQSLNLELGKEIATKAQLEQNISSLSNQLLASQNSLSKKELELDGLRNSDFNSKVNELNAQLQSVSRERDFIQTDFERSIDLEVEALKRYHTALGATAEEIDFAMREVDVVLDSDPRKARAFEIEKYATYAGFSKDQIQKGIDAVNKDDWDTQKEVFKDITKALSKNPNWEVDVPSNAEFNVMIEEEKAIQAAVFQSMELEKVKEQVQNSIKEKTKDIQPLIGLNTLTLKSAVTWEGMAEHEPLVAEIDRLLEGSQDIKLQQDKINQFTTSISEVSMNADKLFKEYSDNRSSTIQNLDNLKTEYNRLRNLPSNQAYKRENWDRRLSINMQIWNTKVPQSLNKDQVVNLTKSELEKGIRNAENEISYIRDKTSYQARENLIKSVEQAKIEYDSIIEEESKPLKEIQSKVAKTLKEVPTFEANADLVSDLDPAMLRAKLSDITSGSNNDVEALEAARKAMAEMGDKPVSEFMTGPYWEMTNVKAAAIVRSKKYDYVDDYEYMNAYYRDPLELNSSQRTEVESELKNVLGKNNMKLQAINTKVDSLTNELSLTKEQSQNLTAEISNLENEVSSLKTSETEIQNQISNLSNQFSTKENLIAEKTQNLDSLQNQLNPLSDKMTELEGQRAKLDTKLNNQLNTIATQIESQGQSTEEANTLKSQFESQITELDTQLQKFEKQSVEINTQLTLLTKELTTLETETPEISEQISKLNNELKNVIEIKADLAMTQAIKSGINVNEKILATVAKLENKSIVQIEGTELMRIVDTDTLTDDVGDFEAPVGTFTKGNQVYLAGAVTREQILSVGKIDATGDLNIQLSQVAAEKINSGMFGLETAKGLVATDDMDEGVYTMIDPKTGRQVMDSHSGNALYGGIICSGEQCGPSGDLGKKVAASGYVFVKQGDIDQGTMCTGGDCVFNISKSELETFNKQITDGVESPFGYDDALAAATVNTKGLVLDSAIGEAAGEVTKEFFSGKFNIMEEGGQESLLQKAKDAVSRLETAKASGQNVENMLEQARGQVAAEQSVLDAVNAAKAASASTTQVASAASEAASVASEAASEAAQEVTKVVQTAAHEIVDGVRAQKNVVQLVQNGDGSISVIVGRTGVNVTGNQKVVFSGLTDAAANSGWGCDSNNAGHSQAADACGQHRQAIAEAEAASGLKVNQGNR
jgi:chromosome segregation ATPase